MSPSQKHNFFSQMLVSESPALQLTWVAVVNDKAESTAAIARMKRILGLRRFVEEVGQEGWLKTLVERLLERLC